MNIREITSDGGYLRHRCADIGQFLLLLVPRVLATLYRIALSRGLGRWGSIVGRRLGRNRAHGVLGNRLVCTQVSANHFSGRKSWCAVSPKRWCMTHHHIGTANAEQSNSRGRGGPVTAFATKGCVHTCSSQSGRWGQPRSGLMARDFAEIDGESITSPGLPVRRTA